jgi:hypothetical protein
MNERIRELALQTKLSPFLTLEHYGTVDALTDLEQMEFKKIHEFAGLIVQECIKMMDTNISGVFNSDWDFETQAKFVKKQFGVEE